MQQILLNGVPATLTWDCLAGEGEQYVEIYQNGERAEVHNGDAVTLNGKSFRLVWVVGAWGAGYSLVRV